MIKDEKLQYDINKEAAKISALSRKIDKYKCLTGEEILPPDQRRMLEQANFAYSPLGKAFEKQTKTIEEQRKKQIEATTSQKERLEALTNKYNHEERLEALTNKYDHKSIYKEIFVKPVKEKI